MAQSNDTDEQKHEEPKRPPVAVSPVVSGSLRELVLRWLFEQSPTTVLLCLILGVMYLGAPSFIASIKDGFKQNADNLAATMKESIKTQVEFQREQTKLILESHDRDRDAFKEAVRSK